MKKLFNVVLCIMMIFSLTGCKDTASMAVEEYLSKYNSLHDDVISDMNAIIESENLSEENRTTYESIFKKQYTDLTYEITEEEYDGDEAIVKAKIKVYDLYKVQNDASVYLANNQSKFNDENGKYDVEKFIKYKLEQMKNTVDTVEYTIDFYLVKTSQGWVVSSLSRTDLEKIHGIYNYES
ncbi:MAG: hypothetical protein E7164_00755 [Firmicutes bacterium]|nr:hypothetical protein [Bacillota bacterium]